MSTLTYEPLDQVEATRQAPRGYGRSACPLCDGTLNRVSRTTPRWSEAHGHLTRVACVYCQHCAIASVAEFPVDARGRITGRALNGTRGNFRGERLVELLERHPESKEGIDL